MRLLGNRIIAEPVIETMRGNLHLPATATDYYNTGGVKVFRVLQVGTGHLSKKGIRLPVECEPGDKVLCHSYSAAPKKFDDRTFVITTDQIIAIIPKQCTSKPEKHAGSADTHSVIP